jgi:hypothetical protein
MSEQGECPETGHEVRSTLCAATRRAGLRCLIRPRYPSIYCWRHQPDYQPPNSPQRLLIHEAAVRAIDAAYRKLSH